MNALATSIAHHLPARVNGTTIDAASIAAESRHHADAPQPLTAARQALVVGELLRQRAVELALLDNGATLDDAALDALLACELRVPEPTRDDCERYYAQHRERFVRDELVYASHILFALKEHVPVAPLLQKAENTLRELVRAPDTFEAVARELSNCPSAAVGGSLGQLARGDTVPEFESALFGNTHAGVLPRVVRTRYGFHLVRVDKRVPGNPMPFDDAQEGIARFLAERVRHKAIQQYVGMLAAGASLENAALDTGGLANGPLVQ